MAQLSQLLLYDPDPRGLDTLTFGFEKDGCSVTGTADAAKARDLAHSANPSLVIVSLRANEQAGMELLHAVTANPRTRNVPVVAIGAEEFRAAALDAGAFVFLSTPMFLRDVIGACRMVVAAAVPGSRPSPDTELSMKLEDLDGVYFLVRALAVTGRSAAVEARHGNLRGELRFIDGTLTSADLASVQGLPALHQMLLWEDAALHFKFKNVVRRGSQISLKSSEVLEECDRFLRDFAHEAKDLGVARTIYVADLAHVQPSDALPGEVVPILKLFDGRRDLAQVLDESPFRVFDTLKIIKRFATDGAIQSTTPAPRIQAGATSGGGAGALAFWLQKQAPALGNEFVVGLEQNGVPTAPAAGVARAGSGNGAGHRHPFPASSPFVALGTIVVGDPSAPGRDVLDQGGIPNLRVRTITKKNVADGPAMFPDDMVTPPPVVNGSRRGDSLARNASRPGAPSQSHVQPEPQVQPRLQPNHLNRFQPPVQPHVHQQRQFQMHPSPSLQAQRQPLHRDPQPPMGPPPERQPVAVTAQPPAQASAVPAVESLSPSPPELETQAATAPRSEQQADPEHQMTLPTNDAPARPSSSSAVARGEIKISLTSLREHESGPIPETPSVLVELADPLPTVVIAPALDDHHPPVLLASNSTPSNANGETAHGEPAPPSVIVAPMTPAPELLAPNPIAAVVVPEMSLALAGVDAQPLAASPGVSVVPSLAQPTPAFAAAPAEPKRHGRSPSDSFNAMEADFFDREADLYKRESVESFDDLDHHQNGTRKR